MDQSRGDDALPERVAGPRASDDDRLVVVTRLREAAGEGLIDLDELEQRIAATYEARTLPELAPITADLPATKPQAPPTPQEESPSILRSIFGSALDSPGFQHHLTVYLSVMFLLFTIWALAGAGFPWPLIVGAAWGTGLAPHWVAAKNGREKSMHQQLQELGQGGQQHGHGHDARQAARDDRREEQLRRRQEGRERRGGRYTNPSPPVPPVPAVDPTPSVPPSTERASDVPTRRFVVAMFVDVVNSTRLNEALGDDQWSALRRATRRAIDEAVTSHGGWEANTSGDGVLARFEHPASAASAAVDILRAFERQRETTGFAPSVRVGIHSGDAVDEDGDIIGNVVNLAARVTGAAEPDEILVTEHVADHLGSAQRAEGRGLHTLKGIERPRHLLSLRWR